MRKPKLKNKLINWKESKLNELMDERGYTFSQAKEYIDFLLDGLDLNELSKEENKKTIRKNKTIEENNNDEKTIIKQEVENTITLMDNFLKEPLEVPKDDVVEVNYDTSVNEEKEEENPSFELTIRRATDGSEFVFNGYKCITEDIHPLTKENLTTLIKDLRVENLLSGEYYYYKNDCDKMVLATTIPYNVKQYKYKFYLNKELNII
jgi:hypothetical protein